LRTDVAGSIGNGSEPEIWAALAGFLKSKTDDPVSTAPRGASRSAVPAEVSAVDLVSVFRETNGSGSRTPTLLALDAKGSLLALATAVPSRPRSAETRSHPVTGTWMSTSETAGKSWSPQKLVPIPEGYGGTQALVDSSTGHVFLFLSPDPAMKQHCPVCRRFYIKSTDRG